MNIKHRVLCVVQARLDSSRLPNKALADLAGKAMIVRMLERIKKSKLVSKIYVATGIDSSNDALVKECKNIKGVNIYRGSNIDVLKRFYEIAILEKKPDIIVRITADCPLVDYNLIDNVISLLIKEKTDYASNILDRTYPDGLDVEAFTFSTLQKTYQKVKDNFSKEHVTTYMHGISKKKTKIGKFRKSSLKNNIDFSFLRWTVDEIKDLEFMEQIFKNISNYASWEKILTFLYKNPILIMKNREVPFNESIKEKVSFRDRYRNSNNFFKRSMNSVPLASQTFSKSYIQWPKGVTPLFLERGQDASVVDIDGNHYLDYVLGLLPITLGYCDIDVDKAVMQQINKGTIFSLPSKLETLLSEKLIEIIPSAEYVRFGKNGSDVTTAAIRIARAFTSKDLIAVAGYHGWHDWYIGTSTRDLGVPNKIKNLTKKFIFNDIKSFKNLLAKFPNKFAAAIIEPAGLIKTDLSFLKELKKLCRKENIVLIFDEIISGFRIDLGGAQKKFGVIPDISCFGKGMANGYPLSAIVGKKKIMRLMEDIFFSTTFGGDTSSLAASLATINKMEKYSTINTTNQAGKKIVINLNQIIQENRLDNFLEISKNYWWPQVIVKDNLPLRTDVFNSLLRQELLKNGLIIGSTLNLCYAHAKQENINNTIKKFNKTLKNLKIFLDSKNPSKFLKGSLIRSTFSVRN